MFRWRSGGVKTYCRRSSPTWRPAHAPFKLWRVPTTRDDLLAWVHAHGLAALDELFGAEAVALAGPKGRHQPQRSHHHWGTAATELTFGGRRVQVRRPRVRQTIGGEATLPSVAAFRDRDPLTARMMQQLLAGVSTRHYEGSLEARPSGRPTRGSSKSAVR